MPSMMGWRAPRIRGVSMVPGQTALTVILYIASSLANTWVRRMTAALVAQ